MASRSEPYSVIVIWFGKAGNILPLIAFYFNAAEDLQPIFVITSSQ